MARQWFLIIIAAGWGFFTSKLIASESTEKAGKRLLGLIEYIRGDYPEAVKKGAVVDKEEFAEMQEFSEAAANIFQRVATQRNLNPQDSISQNLHALRLCILEKCDYSEILHRTATLKDLIIERLQIPSSPPSHPDRTLGKQVFEKNCAVCHGNDGRGDGPGARGLKPQPRSFHDDEYMALASPFKFYNSTETGIENTAMVGFPHLSVQELWSVSFYMLGLRYEDSSPAVFQEIPPANLSLPLLAKASDQELHEWLENNLPAYVQFSPSEQKTHIAYARLLAPYDPRLPVEEGGKKEVPSNEAKSHWDFISASVQKAKDQFHNGLTSETQGTLLDAYLEGFEHVEVALALVDKQLMSDIERSFSATRGFAGKGDSAAFDRSIAELESLLQKANDKLHKKSETPSLFNGDFLSALLIILREGLEAFLIVVALLLIVKNLGAHYARKWIHAGWVSAIFTGVLAYFLFEHVLKISGAAKETIEAFCTGLAVAMLFYTGFWLLSQSEQKKWQQYIRTKTNHAISSRKLWVLFSMSFIAVFREAAETILFYAALLSSSHNDWMVVGGFSTGLVTLLLGCFAILKFNVRIPLKQFFRVTSLLMILLSVILAGKTVKELVEAGYLKASPVEFLPSLDVLGIYPFWETLLAQALLIVGGCFVAALFKVRRREAKESKA